MGIDEYIIGVCMFIINYESLRNRGLPIINDNHKLTTQMYKDWLRKIMKACFDCRSKLFVSV